MPCVNAVPPYEIPPPFRPPHLLLLSADRRGVQPSTASMAARSRKMTRPQVASRHTTGPGSSILPHYVARLFSGTTASRA
ncbi:hypothetical protein NDU88_004483 [Pleurodeles waltl]|uniref:Uncharacterized protein n=1 Tax=Pleurodeles waltl TaxID=8319 RepID=A0AAV7LI73_PLEWA|nr:hypothetical protein NDU88_004483 [Pleurodeles waltl]